MNGYLSPRVPDIFPGLPFGQDMRVAWRQVVRRNGLLVEDNGVASDYMVKPVIGDLNGVVVSYFETIGNHLESIAKISGASFTSCMSNVNLVYATPDTQSDVEVGSRVVFDCTFSFMTSLILIIDNFTGDEIVVGSLTTAKSIKSSSARLESFNVISLTGIDNYKIVGYLDYRQVLITRRKIRYIPRKVDFLTLEQGYTNIINFTNSFTGIYNIDTNNELGWNLKNDILVIQDGESYSNNVDSSVSFFIDIPQSTVAVSGCVKSTDYWSSNLDDQTWFLSPKFFLDNESIPITAIMDPFEYPGIYYYLAREAISARLNILNKSPASERVLTILTDTFSVLQQYNQFDLDSKVKVNDSVYLVSQLINFLIQYNTGLNIKDTGDPPSCVFNPAFNVGLEFDCEMGQDKISINVKVDGQVIRRLDSFSGIEHVDRSFYLDGFIGKSFEIEVRFVSDEDITGGAVKITTASFSL